MCQFSQFPSGLPADRLSWPLRAATQLYYVSNPREVEKNRANPLFFPSGLNFPKSIKINTLKRKSTCAAPAIRALTRRLAGHGTIVVDGMPKSRRSGVDHAAQFPSRLPSDNRQNLPGYRAVFADSWQRHAHNNGNRRL